MPVVPPLKSQGIKTRLVEWIAACADERNFSRWVEPFMGTGAVAFNIHPKSALLCDSNPHIIAFYKAIQTKEVTGEKVCRFLTKEGAKLQRTHGEHYYSVRERFNASGNPLDFLFLSRSCFNGMMRFNKKGGFNVPFCRKPGRFAKSLTTKISNQVEAVSRIIENREYEFRHQKFQDTLEQVSQSDMIYCDPPYIGRHVDYFDSWTAAEEVELHALLTKSGAPFIMSTWLKNRYRKNSYVGSLWKECTISIKEHFYHVGAKEVNRNAVFEALLTNFPTVDGKDVGMLQLDGALLDIPDEARTQKSA